MSPYDCMAVFLSVGTRIQAKPEGCPVDRLSVEVGVRAVSHITSAATYGILQSVKSLPDMSGG